MFRIAEETLLNTLPDALCSMRFSSLAGMDGAIASLCECGQSPLLLPVVFPHLHTASQHSAECTRSTLLPSPSRCHLHTPWPGNSLKMVNWDSYRIYLPSLWDHCPSLPESKIKSMLMMHLAQCLATQQVLNKV